MNRTVNLAPDQTALKRHLKTAILESGHARTPSVFESSIAGGFADRIVTLSSAGTDSVLGWLEQVCQRYTPSRTTTAMIERSCSVARRILRSHQATEMSDDDFASVEDAVSAVLDRYLEKDLRNAEVDAADDIEGAMGAFLLELDDADPASAEHSRAVALWCKRIARRLDLTAEKVLFASRCGLLHDVGKTRTPKEVLQAARGLTKEEWVLMRAHTTEGALMIEDVPLLRPFAPAVRWHHERLDGMGYPDGLSANDIPLHIRIVTVADCFNAMIGRRPYRLPMAPSAALQQLIEHREKQFDPLVVEAMIDVVERGG